MGQGEQAAQVVGAQAEPGQVVHWVIGRCLFRHGRGPCVQLADGVGELVEPQAMDQIGMGEELRVI